MSASAFNSVCAFPKFLLLLLIDIFKFPGFLIPVKKRSDFLMNTSDLLNELFFYDTSAYRYKPHSLRAHESLGTHLNPPLRFINAGSQLLFPFYTSIIWLRLLICGDLRHTCEVLFSHTVLSLFFLLITNSFIFTNNISYRYRLKPACMLVFEFLQSAANIKHSSMKYRSVIHIFHPWNYVNHSFSHK